jgi:integrase
MPVRRRAGQNSTDLRGSPSAPASCKGCAQRRQRSLQGDLPVVEHPQDGRSYPPESSAGTERSAFPDRNGHAVRIGNYLKRVLKPIAATAGIPDMTYRALRRTFATEFQRHGSPKDAQAQLRHSKLEMTGWYMRDIPEGVRSAVAEMDSEICQVTEANAPPDAGRPQ